MTDKIDSFQGYYRFLSNFWPAEVCLDGVVYPSVEHAYVAAKTLDLEMREQIRQVQTPGQVKRFGRKLQLRPDWDDVKVSVMKDLVAQKFAEGTDLRKKLDETSPAYLEEGNTWGDRFWGVCKGEGLNHLGKILMEVRTSDQSLFN